MAQITKITVPKKSPRKRAVYLDGGWAFNCLANVVEKFKLAVGGEVTPEMLERIKGAEVQQKALDKGLAILSTRLHSDAELRKKLARSYSVEQVEAAMADLKRLGYVDDVRFARAKATAAAEYKKHGQRRAYVELIKSGVTKETARQAAETVYEAHDSLKVARELATKKAPALRRLDGPTARRRLAGLLLRRGFTYEEVKPVIDEVLGTGQHEIPPIVHSATGELLDAVIETLPSAETEAEVEAPVSWRESLLSHHHRRNEKTKSKWGSRQSSKLSQKKPGRGFRK